MNERAYTYPDMDSSSVPFLIINYEFYEDGGIKSKEEISNIKDNTLKYTLIKYDALGLEKERYRGVDSNSAYLESRYVYVDSTEDMVSRYIKYSDGDKSGIEHVFFTNGQIVKKEGLTIGGKPFDDELFFYNNDKLLDSVIEIKHWRDTKETIIFERTDRKVSEIQVNENVRVDYFYNDHDNIVQMKQYRNGHIMDSTNYSYTYNEKGHWIRKEMYRDNMLIYTYLRDYSYW